MNTELRAVADNIIDAAIKAVLPDEAVKRTLNGTKFDGKVILVAVGKAAWQMAKAASDCWDTIIAHDLDKFATSYMASFNAQIAMFPPGVVISTYVGHPKLDNSYIQQTVDTYSSLENVLAWKMPGAGGGGYLALVVKDA